MVDNNILLWSGIWANKEMIKDAEDCWAKLKKKVSAPKWKQKEHVNKETLLRGLYIACRWGDAGY